MYGSIWCLMAAVGLVLFLFAWKLVLSCSFNWSWIWCLSWSLFWSCICTELMYRVNVRVQVTVLGVDQITANAAESLSSAHLPRLLRVLSACAECGCWDRWEYSQHVPSVTAESAKNFAATAIGLLSWIFSWVFQPNCLLSWDLSSQHFKNQVLCWDLSSQHFKKQVLCWDLSSQHLKKASAEMRLW